MPLLFALLLAAADPPEDAAHRADRLRTQALNRDALRASGSPGGDVADDDVRANHAAQARYREELAAWRRRVTACRSGDPEACR